MEGMDKWMLDIGPKPLNPFSCKKFRSWWSGRLWDGTPKLCRKTLCKTAINANQGLKVA